MEVFRHVTVPFAAPAHFGGAILCWPVRWVSSERRSCFAGQFLGRTQTMPLAIYAALESDADAALGLSVLLLVISAAGDLIWVVGAVSPLAARLIRRASRSRGRPD